MSQRPVLGKGLASLFPNMAPPSTAQPAPPSAPPMGTGAVAAGPATSVQQPEMGNKDRIPGISFAMVDELQANQYQPRREFDDHALQELSASIRANGIIQPLVVRRGPKGEYQLIAGERRLRAAKMAGLKTVPIVIRRSTDREALELALIENIQRENLNCIDEALAYFQLMQDFQLTQEEVATRVGKDRATVANYLRLLRLPQQIIEDLKLQILSFGHGKALLGIEENDLRIRARNEIVEKKLSVRATEALIDEMKKQAERQPATSDHEAPRATPLMARMANLAQELTRSWSTRVELRGSERRGKIVFHYASRQELDRLLESMQTNRS